MSIITECRQPEEVQIDDFETSELRLRHAQSRIGAILMLVLIPAGLVLDYFVYPEHLFEFAIYRLSADALVLVALLLHGRPWGEAHPDVLVTIWLGAAIIMICTMIFRTEGGGSSYYVGLVLAILAIGILLPLRVIDAVVLAAATTLLYVGVCLLSRGASIDAGQIVNNLYFLVLAGIISVTAVYFAQRRRRNEYELSAELKLRNNKLAALDEMKTAFFANVSHELRTPLTLILSPTAELLKRDDIPPPARDMLAIVDRAASRLFALVTDLLDLIKFDQAKIEFERHPVDLSELAAGIVEQFRFLARNKGIELGLEPVPGPIFTNGDRAALERVLINLISNALKFTDEGGCIAVAVCRKGDRVELTVTDTGIGIDETQFSRLFDRFEQIDGTSTRRAQGLGLGLAIVREILALHDGSISVRSKIGEGSQFAVDLPLFRVRESVIMLPSNAAGCTTQSRIDGNLTFKMGPMVGSGSGGAERTAIDALSEQRPSDSNRRRYSLHIVDDEPEMQRYLTSVLSNRFDIAHSYEGHIALRMIEENPPDLILLDYMLPGMNGGSLCKQIKTSPRLAHCKIIALTARADEGIKLEMLAAGADDFLTKPFSVVELRTRLINLEETARQEEEIRRQNIELTEMLERLGRAEAQVLHNEKLASLGTMAAGILHEINNPLNYASAALSLALQNEAYRKDADLTELLTDAEDGVRRVHKIVSELRTFAAPPLSDQGASFAVDRMIKSALRLVATELAGHEVLVDCPSSLHGWGREQQLTQVCVNLLLNAARACSQRWGEQRGRIGIKARCELKRVIVSLEDNGIGIPQERLTRIFDPFYTTSDVGQGMGLGLSVSHSIVKRHGGRLEVESESGKGSTFIFDFPADAT